MKLSASVEDELVHRQVMLAESAGQVVTWAVDDIIAIDLLGSPVLGVSLHGEIDR